MTYFRTESELVMAFSRNLSETITSQSIRLFDEFETPNGIADLVLAQIHDNKKQLISLGQFSPRWITALAAFNDKALLTADFFSEKTGLSRREASSALIKFSADDYVVKINSKEYRKTSLLKPVVHEFCAVEAKLRDWKKALYQAYRYQDFANKSWVLLDAANIKPALANIGEFNKLNVGLATINSQREVRIYFNPHYSQPRFHQAFWSANCLISKKMVTSNTLQKIFQSPFATELNGPDYHVFP